MSGEGVNVRGQLSLVGVVSVRCSYRGGMFLGGNCQGGNCLWGNYRGFILRGTIIQGKVVLEPKSILMESLIARQRQEANTGI